MTLEHTLRNHAFTQGLSARQVDQLAALATEVAFAENEVVFMDRIASQHFYLVTAGSVTVELRSPIFTVSVLTVGPGQAFGWSSLLNHQDALFQVRAREQTTALRIPGLDLNRLCHEDSQLGVEILMRTLQVVAGRIQATEARFAEICGVRVKSSANKKEHSII